MGEGLTHFLRRKAVSAGVIPIGGAGNANVLMYHGVCPDTSTPISSREIRRSTFQRHLELFRTHFHVVPLKSLFDGERHPDKLTVALTFDDGLRNNVTEALPLLEEYQTSATIFVTGANECGIDVLWGDLLAFAERHHDGPIIIDQRTYTKNAQGTHVDASGRLLKQVIKLDGGFKMKQSLRIQLNDLVDGLMQQQRGAWQLMTDKEIQHLHAHPLIEIGAHGYRHTEMGSTSTAASVSELRSCKSYFEQLLGFSPTALAWPSGSYNNEVVNAAMELGFTQQLAVILNASDGHRPRTLLPRHGMFDYPSNDRFYLHEIAQSAFD